MSEQIVRRVAAEPGNQALWVQLYEKLRPAIYYAAYRACRGAGDIAADLTQATFERLIRYADIAKFDSDAQLAAYLRQTVRRLAWDELRRMASIESLDPEVADTTPPPWAPDSSDTRDVEADLNILIAELSPEDRALVAKILVGRSLSEIADEAGISYSAAAVRIHRLKDKMSSKYKDL